MKNESERQFLPNCFLLKYLCVRHLVIERENRKNYMDSKATIFFCHAYGRNADSLVQTCNKLQKVRTQESGLMVA